MLGYDRDAMLARHLPRTAADAAARRDAAAADLTRRIARNEAASKGLMTELAQLGDDTSPASTAYRTRIRERFTQLYDETAALQAQVDLLAAQDTAAADADLIAQIPYAPGLLASAPAPVQEALCAALGIHATYRADKNQITIRAVLTDTTPGILQAILADPRTDGDSPKRSPNPFAESSAAPMTTRTRNISRRRPAGIAGPGAAGHGSAPGRDGAAPAAAGAPHEPELTTRIMG